MGFRFLGIFKVTIPEEEGVLLSFFLSILCFFSHVQSLFTFLYLSHWISEFLKLRFSKLGVDVY